MEITESKKDDIVTLALAGRLDASNAGTLEEKILALIAGGARRFVVDAARMDYISSAGLRVLLVAAKRLNANDGKVVIAALKDQVKEVFDIAGFSSIFEVYGTADEAVSSIR